MPTFSHPDLPSQFRRLLGQCRDLYVSSGELVVREHGALISEPGERFVQLMDDLHRALVVKTFVAICEADRRWSANEKFLAEVLLFHLWGQWLSGDALRDALIDMSQRSTELKWYALIRPFDQIAPLRDRIGELESVVVRLSNLIARADGSISPSGAAAVKSIQGELHVHLRSIPIDEPGQHEQADRAGSQAIQKIFSAAERLPAASPPSERLPQDAPPSPPTGGEVAVDQAAAASPSAGTPDRAATLDDALDELDRLVGLSNIKQEVRTLANFLKVQAKRREAGLPVSELSLHMVFSGNPGTGKTTVARIVGKIYGAMGILKKGHLVETDRSGMVAEYAGQTGPKSNKKIDEALDGVLFIDEAYTLIASEGEDPFGHEAVQALLKRMEDERQRLVVVLAGYPIEMQLLLRSNPGLSSRFSRQLEFVDYSVLELSQIFGRMCEKSRYTIDARTRAKTILGLTWLHERRDRHFGNGRTVRNLFEDAIRRQANRIAEIAELSIEQLATLAPEDLEFAKCPAEWFKTLDDGQLKFNLQCPQCHYGKHVPQQFLSQTVRCPKCERDFVAEWGELVPPSPQSTEATAPPASPPHPP